MSLPFPYRALAVLVGVAALGAGCGADLDTDEAEQPVAKYEASGSSVEQPPSTHPIDSLQQTFPAPELAPLVVTQAEPSGRTDACGEVPASLTRENANRRAASSGRTNARQNYVEYATTVQSPLVRLQTKLTVPAKPPAGGTVFLWPGVQPLLNGPHFAPINKGVLQPVLTWGASCSGASGFNSWTISGMYVNVSTTVATHRSCHGGKIMRPNVGDVLDIDIALNGTVWTQTIKNLTSGEQVDYAIDMKGQEQGLAYFDIELPTTAKPVADTVFTENVLTFASPRASGCVPTAQGATDYVSVARLSDDKTKCCIDRITLRAPGVAATTTP